MDDLLLPEGTRLLHIGPHKTGTTALQGALRLARPQLAEHGVVYPGRSRQHSLAARAVTGSPGPLGHNVGSMEDWTALVREVAAAGQRRVIVSSESFTNSPASGEIARSIVAELGGQRVHVLVTLRPLAKIMPSAWQQYVREGMTHSYPTWLTGMLTTAPYDRPTPTFWHRHRHDALVERWAEIVGPDRLTVLVLAGDDPGFLTRSVEQLVGLPTGTLIPEPGRTNRSLTYQEIELVRALNVDFKHRGWSRDNRRREIQREIILHLQTTREIPPGELRITTPDWALARAAEIGAASAERIASLGVRVVGDLSVLGALDLSDSGEPEPVADVALSLAVSALAGAIDVGMTLSGRADQRRRRMPTVGAAIRRLRARTSALLRRLTNRGDAVLRP